MDSEVWTHFDKCVEDATATCKVCKKILSCKGSTTSSLIRHLENVHKLNLRKRKHDVQQPSTSAVTQSKIKPSSSTIDKYLKNQSLEYIIAKLAALDGFTIHAITKSSFIRYSLAMRHLYLPKSPADVMKLVHKYYEFAKKQTIDKIKMQIKDNKKFSLTLDEWTSKRNRRYININIHDCTGEVYNLGLTRILGSCPAETAVELLRNRLESFELTLADIIGCTTDGAAVMVKFGQILPATIHAQLCYNHAINLAVIDILYSDQIVNYDSESDSEFCDDDSILSNHEDANESEDEDDLTVRHIQLPQLRSNFNDTLKRIRKIVKLFKRSPVKNNTLQIYVKDNHGKELNLLLDCRTRWGSLCTMIERFLLIGSSIQKALVDVSLQHLFVANDLIIIEQLLHVLKPIKLAVEALSRQDANLLTSEGVLKFLFETLENESSHISTEMLSALKSRISQRRKNDIISVMKFLQNPPTIKQKNNNFFKMESKQTIINVIKEYTKFLSTSNINPVHISGSESESDVDVAVVDTVNTGSNNRDALSEMLNSSIANCLKPMKIRSTLDKLCLTKTISAYEMSGILPPILKAVLDSLKSIQPTSTESERIFSLAGNVVCIKRHKLSDSSINVLCFLKSFFLRQN